MTGAGAVLLAGGLSTRMGSAKADLDWHGTPLLVRVCGLLLRAVPGPVVVVRAAGQRLPELPDPGRVVVLADPEPALGPLAGLATGLHRLAAGGVPIAFACSTDLPLLHPALVRAVLRALEGPGPDGPGPDAAVPEVDGRLEPLAAGYRTGLGALADRLLAGGERRATALAVTAGAVRLDRAALLADPGLAAADPELHSLVNLNRPADYRAALTRPAPTVTLRLPGPAAGAAVIRTVRAWTLGEAVAAAALGAAPASAPADPGLPLAEGDSFTLA